LRLRRLHQPTPPRWWQQADAASQQPWTYIEFKANLQAHFGTPNENKAACALQQTTILRYGEEDYTHRYVRGLPPKVEAIVSMFDTQTLDDAMRMALTTETTDRGVRSNSYRRIIYDNTAMPMELGARHIGMLWDAGAGPAKQLRVDNSGSGARQMSSQMGMAVLSSQPRGTGWCGRRGGRRSQR